VKRGALKQRIEKSGRSYEDLEKDRDRVFRRQPNAQQRPQHQGWKPQCPHCGSYKTGGMGIFGGDTTLWIIHIILTILTGGIWIVFIVLYYLIKPWLGPKPLSLPEEHKYRCRACGFQWTQPSNYY